MCSNRTQRSWRLTSHPRFLGVQRWSKRETTSISQGSLMSFCRASHLCLMTVRIKTRKSRALKKGRPCQNLCLLSCHWIWKWAWLWRIFLISKSMKPLLPKSQTISLTHLKQGTKAMLLTNPTHLNTQRNPTYLFHRAPFQPMPLLGLVSTKKNIYLIKPVLLTSLPKLKKIHLRIHLMPPKRKLFNKIKKTSKLWKL